MTVKKDIVGKKFGKLTVLDEYQRSPGATKWKCICDCGNELFVYRHKLIDGRKRSCGCLTNSVKGLSRHKLYTIWWEIKERCYSEKHVSYKNYGAKGILVCDKWKDFLNFYDWAILNGYREELNITRIDPTLNYSPENCRWITRSENMQIVNKEKGIRSEFIYYGISPQGKYYEFSSARQFAIQHNLSPYCVTSVANKTKKTHKKWTFGYTNKKNLKP